MATGWIILAQFVCIQLASGACPNGKTGPRCTYDCHCNSSPCDESSNCGGSCVNGWRGRTCQQENVALRKPTESSQTRTNSGPEKAVDGNMGTEGNEFQTAALTPSARSAWWSVDLQTLISVQDVVIYFRIDYTVRRNGVELYVSNTKPIGTDRSTWGSHCYTVQGRADGTNINDTFSIPQCQGSWRYLFIYTDTDNSRENVGPMLDFREVEVYACARGTFGSDCSQFCDGCNSDGCDSSGQCISGCRPGKMTLPGCTEDCQPGRYGADCASFCSDRGCLTSPDTCNAETGECSSGCKSNGFSTPDCSVCTMGWYGDSCDKHCTLRQCAMQQQDSICDRTRVACPPGGCKPGYTGNDCATECLNFYGENCSKSCSSRQCADRFSSCDHISGACVPEECKQGYRGRDCQHVCTPTTYGRGCVLPCGDRKCFASSSSCDHVTGQCDGGCKAGWNGSDCTKVCIPTTYGRGCLLSCEDRKCFESSSSCDHVTGQCDGGCKAGWNGSDCTQECLTGTYGANCVKSCSSRHCRSPSSSCDHETGQCPDGCQDGWNGQDCSTECPEGIFGLGCLSCSTRHCKGTSDCPGDGTCSGGCQDGWTLDSCTQACPSGTYGHRCGLTCGNCTGDNICNHVTGNCPGDCKAGWQGSQCKQTCPSGKYGVNCMETCVHCADTCDVVDGHCLGGCKEGYCGAQCHLRLMSDTGVDSVSAVIGAVIGVVVMFVVNGAVLFCLLRYGRLQWVKSSRPKDSMQPREMTDITRPRDISHGVAERSLSGSSHTYNNDYAVLDTENKSDNKDYDVIKSKQYENQ